MDENISDITLPVDPAASEAEQAGSEAEQAASEAGNETGNEAGNETGNEAGNETGNEAEQAGNEAEQAGSEVEQAGIEAEIEADIEADLLPPFEIHPATEAELEAIKQFAQREYFVSLEDAANGFTRQIIMAFKSVNSESILASARGSIPMIDLIVGIAPNVLQHMVTALIDIFTHMPRGEGCLGFIEELLSRPYMNGAIESFDEDDLCYMFEVFLDYGRYDIVKYIFERFNLADDNPLIGHVIRRMLLHYTRSEPGCSATLDWMVDKITNPESLDAMNNDFDSEEDDEDNNDEDEDDAEEDDDDLPPLV